MSALQGFREQLIGVLDAKKRLISELRRAEHEEAEAQARRANLLSISSYLDAFEERLRESIKVLEDREQALKDKEPK